MFYREMKYDKNMENEDMPDQLQLSNEDQTQLDQSQLEPKWDYPMMNEMYTPVTYDPQIPHQQNQPEQVPDQTMERDAYYYNSYNEGNDYNHMNAYQRGFNEGFNQGYQHQNYNPYYNQNQYSFFPFLPLFFI
ncbi:hypothetical protein E4V42_07515 [Clostridium estertheticum]|uniref:Uncharacterized protein n=1 Tax=Clostridium estertheticum TaxID=238834 RepID=A0A5N7IZP0_9CLOT|nr:hypothetical protein [Clostridium estertheticum]MPQ31282.1 hypothetical protein [Clostridium estertheticum]MPQ61956.1 hypothetical protein [Clostridium estertheticum]